MERKLCNEGNNNRVDLLLGQAKTYFENIGEKNLYQEFSQLIDEDLRWMLIDPACFNLEEIKTKNAAVAVAYYRLGNLILREIGDSLFALKLSEQCYRSTGIYIHPEADIKSPFAIDHGFGIIIGQKAKIGHHCLILDHVLIGTEKEFNRLLIGQKVKIGNHCRIKDNVVIGAEKVGISAVNLKGVNRHPVIGDNVTICGNSRIYGPVNIGSNSFIGPDCVVNESIPDNSFVKNLSKIQIIKKWRG